MVTFSMNAETGEVSIETKDPGFERGDGRDLADKIASSNPRGGNIIVVSVTGPASPQVSLEDFLAEFGAELDQRGLKLVATPG